MNDRIIDIEQAHEMALLVNTCIDKHCDQFELTDANLSELSEYFLS